MEFKGGCLINMKSAICPTCRKRYYNALQIKHIQEFGECMSCEHVRGEVQEHFYEAYYDWDNPNN